MDTDFLSDLCFHCTESLSVPTGRAQKQAQKEYEALEQKFIQTMGWQFVERYQHALFLSLIHIYIPPAGGLLSREGK